MPLIRVVSRMGRPPPTPLQASFGTGTGTLGRSPDCTLALPDEDRHISRRQARIDVAGGAASITCLSAGNPLIINGHELRQGETRPLVHGDRIHVAEYELRFEDNGEPGRAAAGPALPDDPFAFPAFEAVAASSGRRDVSNPASRAPGLRAEPFTQPSADPFADPFADSSADPFACRVPDAVPDASADPLAVRFEEPNPRGPLIPEGFDPFAEPAANPHRSGGTTVPVGGSDPLGMGLLPDPMAELAAGRADSIDALFDLKPGMDPLGPDSPLGRPPGEKPRDAKSSAADRAGDPIPDNAPVLSGSFRLPQAIPASRFAPEDPIVSWKDALAAPGAARSSSATTGGKTGGAPVAAPVAGSAGNPPAVDPSAGDRSAGNPSAGDPSELLRALLLGLGFAELPRTAGEGGVLPQALTPELMQRIGELLATACDGTVELLQARATLKQELRAAVTMIQAQDNNPLKFAPDGHAALDQLLKPSPVRGFMEPRRAMRDAYDDLLAHQIGFVAGMRAAMQGMVGRFDPEVLEKRLAGRSVLDTMVPAARKARLWELFNSLYAEVAREAEDDFQRLFGRAFVHAYEEQIARLERAPARPGPPSGGAGSRG